MPTDPDAPNEAPDRAPGGAAPTLDALGPLGQPAGTLPLAPEPDDVYLSQSISQVGGGAGLAPTATLDPGPAAALTDSSLWRHEGARYGRWTLGKLLGHGGFGEVWRAVDDDGRVVALKVLDRATAAGMVGLKNEGRALLGLAHPGLVVPFELLTIESELVLAMEAIDGPPIDAWVVDAPPDARPGRVERALAQLTDAIGYLHRAGTLHLDIKPANVLVRPDGRVAVLDFGLARPRDTAAEGKARLRGTPGFIPPEVWRGEDAGAPADWFAVGAVLHVLITGAPAFQGTTIDEFRSAALAGLRARPRPAIPVRTELVDLVLELLEPDPARRAGEARIREVLGIAGPAPISARAVVGRERELGRLQSAATGLHGGAPSVAYVHAPSGMGKSRVLRELLAREAAAGALVVRTACHQHEHLPFAALDGLVDGLVTAWQARLPTPPPAEAEAVLAPLARVFPVARLLARPGGRRESPDPVTLRRETAGALSFLLRALVAERPLLLAIDDVQWGDDDSLALLAAAIAPLEGRVHLALAGRDAEPPGLAPLRSVCSGPRWTTLALGPLGADDARALLRGLLADDLGDARTDALLATAEGSPFLVETLARLAPAVDPGQDLAEQLPRALRAAAAALGPAAAGMLDVVCLGVGPMDQAVAAAAVGLDDPRPALHLLRAGGFVTVHEHDGRGHEVEPHHARVRAAVVAGIADERRRGLHRALWEGLTAAGHEPGARAWHAHHAGEDAAAAGLAQEAAERAEAALAYLTAADRWRDALEWGGGSAEERRALGEKRARALMNAGHSAESGKLWQALAADAPADLRPTLEERAVDALLAAGEYTLAEGSLTRALVAHGLPALRTGPGALVDAILLLVRAVFTRAAPAADAAEPDARRIDLLWSAGRAFMVVNPPASLPLMLRSLILAERAGDRGRAGRIGALLGLMFAQFPGFSGVGARFQRRADERRGEPYQDAICDMWDAYARYYALQLGAAADLAERAIARMEGPCPGLPWETARAREVRALVAWLQGDLRGFARVSDEALRAALARGDLQGQAIANDFTGRCALFGGDVARARALAARIDEQWIPGQYTVSHFFGTALAAACDVYEDAPEAGLARLLADEPRYRKAGGHRIPLWRIDWLLTEARLRLVQPDLAAQAAPLERVAAALAKETRADGPAHAAWVRAALAAGRGGGTAALEAVRAGYRERDLGHFDLAVGAAIGDPASADRLRALGVVDPVRWARATSPVPA